MAYKRCPDCGVGKAKSEFYTNKARRNGLDSICKLCRRIRSASWQKKNPERATANKRIWEAKNRNRYKEKRHLQYLNHRQEVIARARTWKRNNPESVSKSEKKYRLSNAEKYRQHCRTRRARKAGAIGPHFTGQQWHDLKVIYDFSCIRCGRYEPEIKLSPDHVIPLEAGGSDRIENIQPLCFMVKGSRAGNCQSIKGKNAWDYR